MPPLPARPIPFLLVLFATAVQHAQNVEVEIWWTDGSRGRIQRARADGSRVEDVITGLSILRGVALDAEAGKVYFAYHEDPLEGGRVARANLDGSAVEDLVSPLLSPLAVALDRRGRRIYWANNGGGARALERANLDGSGHERLIVGVSPRDIALDLDGGRIYWTDIGGAVGERTIRRADLNGANMEIVISGLGNPDGLDLDLASGRIYWTDQGTQKIQRAGLDGSDVEDLVTTGLDRPFGIRLSLSTGTMYWADWGTRKIQRAHLDGGVVEDVVSSGLVRPLYMAIIESAPSFRRGDADADGRLNVTDPVVIVRHLFRSGRRPPCMKAADVNDNGRVEIADAIRLFVYLFQFGEPPAEPFPACGEDATPDLVGCALFPSCP